LNIDFQNAKPIFVQISESIEDGILSGAYPEETQIPSTTEISVNYKINPATALKGVNTLVDNEIVYKKRGVGMFVSSGAAEKIRDKRRKEFFDNYIVRLITEAKKLNLTGDQIIEMVERGLKNELH
jgi:DNA-binding transcriptional regulator YhcF (GntR family)